MKHKKKMGVIGGMGPLATMDFATKVVRFTEASCDQEHIPMIIDNRIQIPDRTNYILNGTNSPLSELIACATPHTIFMMKSKNTSIFLSYTS